MKVRYDPDADVMYIALSNAVISRTEKIDDYTLFDVDADGNIVGVELLFVKERSPTLLSKLRYDSVASA